MKFALCFTVKFVDVERDGVEKCFGENICCAAPGESFETVVLLQNTECSFGLDTAVES